MSFSFLKETQLIQNHIRHVLIDNQYYFYVRDITEKYPEVKIVNFMGVKYHNDEPIVKVEDLDYKTPFEQNLTQALKKKPKK